MIDQHDILAFSTNGGVTGARIRARDWSEHALGPVANWPSALRTTLGIVLGCAFPTFVTWGSGFHLFHNDAYLPMLGGKADGALGQPYPEVWAEVWNDLGPYAHKVMAGESFYFENYATTLVRNGYPELAHFTFSFSPVRDESGVVRGMMCTVIEVSDKVLALARHKEAEERLALSLAASGNIGTWSYDLESGATHVDERFARLFQVDAALARTGTDLGRFTGMIHPDDRPATLAAIDHAIRTETLYDVEYRIPQRTGIDAWVNARGKVFADPATGRRRFAGVAIDITDRKCAEQRRIDSERLAAAALRLAEESTRRLDVLLDAAPVGIIYVDMTGRMLVANAWNRVIWGDHPQPGEVDEYAEWKGWWIDESGQAGARVAAGEWPIARVLSGEETAGGVAEIEPFGMPGVRRTILIQAALIRNDAGEPIGGLAANIEITAQVAAERAMKDQTRRKDEFLAMLAHELRNPLAPIAAAAHMLAQGLLDPAQARRTSEVIVRQVRHMTSLVDDLLDVSRVTRGLVQMDMAAVDLADVVASAVEQVRPLMEARGHALRLEPPEEDAKVLGDRVRLVQIVSNLLNNAAKYTPPGGIIGLSVRTVGATVSVGVTDNGIGIGAEVLPHIFELFTQAERTPDRSQGGLGLGLALVYSLVQLHGGAVHAASAGAGQGSTFTVTLPRA